VVKYGFPCYGGMENVVKSICDLYSDYDDKEIFVYCNNHEFSIRDIKECIDNVTYVRKRSLVFLFSQPLSLLFFSLKKYIQQSDIIHFHYPSPNLELFSLIFLKRLFSKKLMIVTYHANISNSRWKFGYGLYLKIRQRLFKHFDKIVFTSSTLLNTSDLNPEEKTKAVVIPLFARSNYYNFNLPIKRHRKQLRLLFVGRLRKYKGLDILLRAITMLNVKLVIVGEGEEKVKLLDLSKDLNLQNKVVFLGGVNDERLKSEYLNADLFVLPSINESEAFGVVQLEAMSYGLPIINTNLKSGVPSVSLDGFTGLTVNPGNVEELSEAIKILCTDSDLYLKFSANTFSRLKAFHPDKIKQKYDRLYEL